MAKGPMATVRPVNMWNNTNAAEAAQLVEWMSTHQNRLSK
jgi:hypothetical protein